MALPYICPNFFLNPTTVKFSEKGRNKHRFNHFQGIVTFVPILQLFLSVFSTCINDQIQKCITSQGTGYIHLVCLFWLHLHDGFSALFLHNIDIYHKKKLIHCISNKAFIMIDKEAYAMENIYYFAGFSLHFELDLYAHLCTHIRCFIIYFLCTYCFWSNSNIRMTLDNWLDCIYTHKINICR